jgi:YVTN family beta-propeller protein
VTKVGEVVLGGLPEGAVFSPDGKYLYVGNFLDSDVSILRVDGTKVTDTGKRLQLPGHPASMRGRAR